MKSLTIRIAIVCLSAVIFLTGIGVTLINSCCSDCIEMIAAGQSCRKHSKTIQPKQHSCCSEHSSAVEKQEFGCNSDANNDNDCCTTERVSIDLDSFHPKLNIANSFVCVDNTLCPVSGNTTPGGIILRELTTHIKAPPDLFTPRDYLAFIKILVI